MLHGDLGNDTVAGSEGNDMIYGDDGDDILKGELGNDTVYGGIGNDDVRGHQGDDNLFGDDGNDKLTGSSGTDNLNGGAGADILYGQTGSDLFIFDGNALDGKFDKIMDLNISEDRGILFDGLLSFDAVSDVITDFIQITKIQSNRYAILIDTNGDANNFQKVAEVWNMNTDITNEQALYNSGHLLVV